MAQRVTMEEIARRSGVSLATVSLVLRDRPGVNDETRQRVQDAARALGYRRRAPAEPAPPSQRLVGMLIKARANDPPQTNQFYAPVMAGIELACRRQQINLLFATVPVDEDNHPLGLPRMLLEDGLDGLLLVGAFVDSTITRLMEHRSTPIVLVDAYAEEQRYDSVVSDSYGGAYAAVSHLIGLGHRAIGLVGSVPDAYPSLAERRRGYLQALSDHGIAECYFADSHNNDAAESAIALLQRSPQVSALFCCNDVMAIAVMRAAMALGRRIPDDLSIVGFDDIELAPHVSPALTTVRVDKVGMGRLAVQLLLNRAEFPDTACATTTLRTSLVERQSAGPPPVRP